MSSGGGRARDSGVPHSGAFRRNSECAGPTWRFDPSTATGGVSEFEVADGTGRLLYGVSAFAAQRTMRFHGPRSPDPFPEGR
jgi:hypothetical protein